MGFDTGMVGTPAEESALLIVCPEAERAVGRHRALLDPAARAGVPAHLTLIYPFKPVGRLSDEDHQRLEALFAATPGFVSTGATTGWFGEDFLHVALQDPWPVKDLIARVAETFPDFPPYAGQIDDVVPHVTIGFGAPVDVLRSAERDVLRRLPFIQKVEAVELWSGPALASGEVGWQRIRSYPLG